jgi:hypothetical protein
MLFFLRHLRSAYMFKLLKKLIFLYIFKNNFYDNLIKYSKSYFEVIFLQIK